MRIAVFIKSTTFNKGFGGLETQNKLLCEGLAASGCEVVVIAPKPQDAGEVPSVMRYAVRGMREGDGGLRITHTASRVTYVFLDVPPGKYSKQWFRESLKVFQKLHQESPLDVVISQSMAGQEVIKRIAEFGKSADSSTFEVKSAETSKVFPRPIPVVVIQHGTILGELKTRWRSLRVNPKSEYRNSKQILNSNVPNSKPFGISDFGNSCLFRISDFVLRIFGVARGFLRFFLRLVPYCVKIYFLDQLRLRRADKVIAVSDQVRDALIREYFLPPGKVEVVYNGVEIERFGKRNALDVTREELEIGKNDKVILYVGRVEKEKGLGILLRSLSRITHATHRITHNASRITTLVVGNGPYLLDLKGLAERLGIADRVVFTGKVSYEDVPKYYAAADVFVLPSLREEGLPMTLPEAMASGLPIVASRIGGIPAAVKDGETGLLVEPGDIEKLARALENLLADESLRDRMGQSARQLAKKQFSQKAMVEKTLSVMRYALSGKADYV